MEQGVSDDFHTNHFWTSAAWSRPSFVFVWPNEEKLTLVSFFSSTLKLTNVIKKTHISEFFNPQQTFEPEPTLNKEQWSK